MFAHSASGQHRRRILTPTVLEHLESKASALLVTQAMPSAIDAELSQRRFELGVASNVGRFRSNLGLRERVKVRRHRRWFGVHETECATQL